MILVPEEHNAIACRTDVALDTLSISTRPINLSLDLYIIFIAS